MSQALTTPRLILRRWRPSDRSPFRALNADPRVVEHFPAPLAPEESDALIARIEQHFETHGFGAYAAELIESQTFLGFIGLNIPSFEAPFMPAVEIGWRLSADYWNQGLATEGAHAVVRHAFETLSLPALVSFTVPANLRSIRVMEKLGMVRDPAGGFLHPNLPEGHPLRPHVLYRLAAPGTVG